MRKWILTGLVMILVVATILAGCSKDTEGTASDDPITIALSPWPGWFFWYLVEEKGFFEKHDVEVKLEWFPVYSDSLQALATGRVDANSQTLSDTIAPLSKDIKLKAVLVNDNSNGGDAIVSTQDIASIADMKGKTVATELGTVDHLLLLTALEQNGMSERDIKYVNMTVNDAGPAFISGKVDVAVLWEPFQTIAVNEGKGKVLFSSKDTPGLIPDLLVFREEVVKDRAADVQKIVDAWFDALDYYAENEQEAIELMAKHAETTPEDFKTGLDSVSIFTVEDNVEAFTDMDSFESLIHTGELTAEFLKKLDMIDEIPNIEQLLEPKFVNEAAKR